MPPTPSTAAPGRRSGTRLLVLLSAAIAALVAILLPASTASASASPAAGTRVGANSPTVTHVVGVHQCITAGQRPVRGPSQLQIVVGNCVAAEAGGGAVESTTAVIGRQADTAVAKDWAGHEVPDLPANQWTLAKNDQWVQSVVDRKLPVYVGSPTSWGNLWDAAAGRSTVFGRELQQFTKAGYTWDGWTMVPPGGG